MRVYTMYEHESVLYVCTDYNRISTTAVFLVTTAIATPSAPIEIIEMYETHTTHTHSLSVFVCVDAW